MKLIRDELFDAVYSTEFTAIDSGRLQHIPYFDAYRALRRSRNDVNSALQQQLLDAAEKERNLLAVLEGERSKNIIMLETLSANELLIKTLQQEQSALVADINVARAHASRVSAELASEHVRHQAAVESSRQVLEQARLTAAELRQHRQDQAAAQVGFDAFGTATRAPAPLICAAHSSDSKRIVDTNSRVLVRSEISELQKLLKQLCALRSRAIEDFEAALSGKVRLHSLLFLLSRMLSPARKSSGASPPTCSNFKRR
jgi:hypothetical protein